MRSRSVEVLPLFGDGASGMVEAEEQALVRSSSRIRPLKVSMILRPSEDRIRGELRAMVGDDHARLAAPGDR